MSPVFALGSQERRTLESSIIDRELECCKRENIYEL